MNDILGTLVIPSDGTYVGRYIGAATNTDINLVVNAVKRDMRDPFYAATTYDPKIAKAALADRDMPFVSRFYIDEILSIACQRGEGLMDAAAILPGDYCIFVYRDEKFFGKIQVYRDATGVRAMFLYVCGDRRREQVAGRIRSALIVWYFVAILAIETIGPDAEVHVIMPRESVYGALEEAGAVLRSCGDYEHLIYSGVPGALIQVPFGTDSPQIFNRKEHDAFNSICTMSARRILELVQMKAQQS